MFWGKEYYITEDYFFTPPESKLPSMRGESKKVSITITEEHIKGANILKKSPLLLAFEQEFRIAFLCKGAENNGAFHCVGTQGIFTFDVGVYDFLMNDMPS